MTETVATPARAPGPEAAAGPGGSAFQLTLATGAFAVCFAIFGSVAAMMPFLRRPLGLNPVQVSVALAVPVLLGSLGRIPLGVLTDRYGGYACYLGVEESARGRGMGTRLMWLLHRLLEVDAFV